MKTLLYILAGYAAFTLIIFAAQRKLLYLPDKAQLPQQNASAQGLRHWPSYENYRGFIGQATPSENSGTLIVFHGNAGSARYRDYYTDALSRQGFRVLLAEYPGYGARAGKPSQETLVEDALQTVRLAHREFGGPVFLWGESLGGGVACAVAARTDVPIAGLILMTPWDSLAKLAQTHYWYLPARWLVLDRYDNIKNLSGFNGKVAVILAGKDEVIPVKHGRNLYDALNAEKKLWVFDSAGHNSWPSDPQAPWWREVAEYIQQ